MQTDIEQKALAYACECAGRSVHHFDRMGDDLPLRASIIAHARAIEQHEAFRQEVSDAVVAAKAYYEVPMYDLSAFIIAKPDPLVEAVAECDDAKWETGAEYVACLRAAIEARGGKIVWGEG